MEDRTSARRPEKEAAAGVDGDTGVAQRSKAAHTIAAVAEQDEKKAGAKKTRLVKVSQEYMDWLVTTPYKPFRGIPQDILDKDTYVDEGESLRDLMARVAARHQKLRDRDLAILEQYELYGFAEMEVEISDDEDVDDMAPVGN